MYISTIFSIQMCSDQEFTRMLKKLKGLVTQIAGPFEADQLKI